MLFQFYETSEGKDLVYQELMSIKQEKLRELVKKKLAYYEEKEFNQFTRGRDLEKIKRTDLWELKIRTSPPHRALCFLIDLSQMLVLHLFQKGDGPIDGSDIDIAMYRLKDYKIRK